MIHDIAVTPDYYMVVAGPVNFDAAKFVTQYFTSRCSIAECLVYNPSKPTKVHLVPRPKGAAGGRRLADTFQQEAAMQWSQISAGVYPFCGLAL
jgi:all-trans-8'-apo-beta-carotenal 15,15'-oxygenase